MVGLGQSSAEVDHVSLADCDCACFTRLTSHILDGGKISETLVIHFYFIYFLSIGS